MIAITDRHLCTSSKDYFDRIEKILDSKPRKLILREKDLNLKEYEELAKQVYELCIKKNIDMAVNSYVEAAVNIGCNDVQLSYHEYIKNSTIINDTIDTIGVSVHSVIEAKTAEKLGANYLIAGHIYDTNSHKGVPGKGLEYLKEICDSVNIPVYAIGGIKPENYQDIINAGANDACMLSYYFTR